MAKLVDQEDKVMDLVHIDLLSLQLEHRQRKLDLMYRINFKIKCLQFLKNNTTISQMQLSLMNSLLI